MIRGIFYKEWLKIKWAAIVGLILGLLTVGYIFTKVNSYYEFYGAVKYWNNILFKEHMYYSLFKYIPLLIALAIAITQYAPEVTRKRIKLTFHLPLSENKALFSMIGFGSMVLLSIYIIIYLLFMLLSYGFFPADIVQPASGSLWLWYLGGFTLYFFGALVTMEPKPFYRVVYGIVSVLTVSLFYESHLPGATHPFIPYAVIFTLLASVSMIFSATRFKKGEN